MKKLTPFANKALELARNLRLVSDHLGSASELVEAILSRNEDLIILVEELGLSEEELLEAATHFYEIKAEAESIAQQALLCKTRAEDLAAKVVSDTYFGRLLSLPVTRPHQGIFDPATLVQAKKVSSEYIKKLRRSK